MTHLSLCTGIGGIDLAAEWAGFRTVGQCEIDEYASKILAKNFKGVPNLHDIRTVTNSRLRELGIDPDGITVLSAGFPCQPYSLAGKGLGDGDVRDLWGEVARCIGEVRPKWFVGENTPGLFARQNQRYFRRVLNDLTALGYRVSWGIWGACDAGAPHRRDRVFIVGRNSDSVCEQEKSQIQERQNTEPCGVCGNISDPSFKRQHKNEIQRGEFKTSRDETNAGRAQESGLQFERICGCLPDAGSEWKNERRNGQLSATTTAETERDNNGRRAEKYVGGEWWQTEPDVGRVANGVSYRVDRLRCLGNAVVPQQVYPIFEEIARIEREEAQ